MASTANNVSTTPDADDIKQRFHMAFNKKVFNMDLDGNILGNPEKKKTTSNELSREEWLENNEQCKQWNQNDTARQKAFRKNNTRGYYVAKKYNAEKITLANGDEEWQLQIKLKSKKAGGIIMLPNTQIFEAIYFMHSEKGHMKIQPTYQKAASIYANITYKQVQEFIALCPICNSQNPTIAPTKGARNPIVSEHFRDRGQLDLIDMRKRRVRDVNGVMMRWLISFKDHLT